MIIIIFAFVSIVLLVVGLATDIDVLNYAAFGGAVFGIVLWVFWYFWQRRSRLEDRSHAKATDESESPPSDVLAVPTNHADVTQNSSDPDDKGSECVESADARFTNAHSHIEQGAEKERDSPAFDLVVVAPGRRRYHQSGCAILNGRHVEELSIEEAEEEGFTACTVCSGAAKN